MPNSDVRFHFFPQTSPPPVYLRSIVEVFEKCEDAISTKQLEKGLTSNGVLDLIRADLLDLGFQVELGKSDKEKIARPVFFGENGQPELTYEIDAYHGEWRCGLEVEAGRAWMGNAVYRDLVQAMVMVQVDTLIIAVPNSYKFKSGGREVTSPDYQRAANLAKTLYSHDRFQLPYNLAVIGY
jgi:hypothetical protein